jgi:Zn-dependent protease
MNAESVVRPVYVLEPLAGRPRRRLTVRLGIVWLGTARWWICPVWLLVAGLALGLLLGPGAGAVRLLAGLVYALILAASVLLHALGHLAGGKLVGAPMTALLLLALAVGGPVLWTAAIVNLLFTVVALLPVPTMDGGVVWLKRT